jgi:phage gpG-like protein
MFRFQLNIAGEVQLDRGIGRFADGVGDYTPIWPVIQDDFYAEEKAQFASEGAEGGEPWAPLSAQYAGWKELHYPGKPILQRTGALESSLTSASDPNAVHIQGRKALTLGTKLPYAIYHQSIDPRTQLPRRAPINLSEAFKRGVTRHLQTYLVQMATECGFRTGLGPLQGSALVASTGSGIPPQRTLESRVRRRESHEVRHRA